jgi:hypothetical protein
VQLRAGELLLLCGSTLLARWRADGATPPRVLEVLAKAPRSLTQPLAASPELRDFGNHYTHSP